MALMKSTPARFTPQMSRPGFDHARNFAGSYSQYSDFDATGPAAPALERNDSRTRVCLDCALPLHTSAGGKPGDCQCQPLEAFEDEWPAFGAVEIAFIASLVAACIAASFWFWL
jgi:hypothetical protein